MKQFVTALVVVLLSASAVYAKEFSYTACTYDKKVATLKIELQDNTPTLVQKHIQRMFAVVAKSVTAEDLLSSAGFQDFVSHLTPEDKAAIVEIPGPPVISGECK